MTATEVLTQTEQLYTEELAALTPDSFRQALLDIHNDVIPEQHLDAFDAYNNFMGLSSKQTNELEGVEVRFPRREDKAEVLEFALVKAQSCEDPRNGAMLLSAAVLLVHPFNDGNGRTSRALYSKLSGVDRLDESSRDGDGTGSSNLSNREHIDLGSAFSSDPKVSALTELLTYRAKGIPKRDIRTLSHRPDVDDQIESARLTDDELEGFSDSERADFIEALGLDKSGNNDNWDMRGMGFASAVLLYKYPELETLVTTPDASVDEASDGRELLNIHDLLPKLSAEQKSEYVASLWEYRKLRAMAAIDMLSDDAGSILLTGRMGSIALRDVVIESTNNFVSSTIPSDHAAWSSR